MADHLNALVEKIFRENAATKGIPEAVAKLLPLRDAYAQDPENYELNVKVGFGLMGDANTQHYAEPFLINAVNANQEDANRPSLLLSLAQILEA